MELDFIKRVRPFMKIRKAPTSLGQDRIEGSVVHFAKDIHEVLTFTSTLQLASLMTDTIVITEHLDNVKTHCNFTLCPTRINTALEWLFWNNKFYSDLAPYYSHTFGTLDFTDQIFITNTSSTTSNWVIDKTNQRGIRLMPSECLHESHPSLSSTRGAQSVPKSIPAAAYAILIPFQAWIPTTIDQVIVLGTAISEKLPNKEINHGKVTVVVQTSLSLRKQTGMSHLCFFVPRIVLAIVKR